MYEVLLIVELFDMSVYRRYPDVYLKELRTTQGVSALILLSCAAVNTAAELYVDGWIRMVLLIMVLFLFSIQYDRRSMSRILAVCVYIGVTVQPSARFGCSAACFAAKAAKISLLAERHMSKIRKLSLTSKLDGSIFLFLPHG